ncbi:Uncharacterised protein [Vibrio cholerae]|nr:Uncharacterised protein [Vibrio cholerae]
MICNCITHSMWCAYTRTCIAQSLMCVIKSSAA